MRNWQVNGRAATARDIKEQLALARQTRRKSALADRDAMDLDSQARAVAAAIRRAERDAQTRSHSIGCTPGTVPGRRKGGLRSRRFETLAGLAMPRPSAIGADGLSSFHCRITSRGRGNGAGRAYKVGEAVRAIRYILRDAAREIEGGGIVSNIDNDPDRIAGLFAALEEIEGHGRSNSNVYMSAVIALPHELADRETLLREICAPLDQMGLGFAGVLHKPDPGADQRNSHAHIIFSLRPVRRMGGGDFAIARDTLAWVNSGAWIRHFRAHVSDSMNAAMVREGLARRFTPLSNSERGLKLPDAKVSKSTPGRKHHERRLVDIQAMKQEKARIDRLPDAARKLAALVQRVLKRASVDWKVIEATALSHLPAVEAATVPSPPVKRVAHAQQPAAAHESAMAPLEVRDKVGSPVVAKPADGAKQVERRSMSGAPPGSVISTQGQPTSGASEDHMRPVPVSPLEVAVDPMPWKAPVSHQASGTARDDEGRVPPFSSSPEKRETAAEDKPAVSEAKGTNETRRLLRQNVLARERRAALSAARDLLRKQQRRVRKLRNGTFAIETSDLPEPLRIALSDPAGVSEQQVWLATRYAEQQRGAALVAAYRIQQDLRDRSDERDGSLGLSQAKSLSQAKYLSELGYLSDLGSPAPCPLKAIEPEGGESLSGSSRLGGEGNTTTPQAVAGAHQEANASANTRARQSDTIDEDDQLLAWYNAGRKGRGGR